MEGIRTGIYQELFHDALGKEPDDYQLDILSRDTPLVINKARQIGISTVISALAVVYASLGNKKVLICSNKEDSAKHIIQYAWDFIHPMIEHGVIEKPEVDQSGFIRWPDGGEIRCQAASDNAGRGFPVDLAIMDEFAHFVKEIDLDQRIYRSVAPTISQTGGRMIILSTPRGTKNLFYKIWEATPEENRIAIHWSQCPRLKGKVREEHLEFGTRYVIDGLPAPLDSSTFRQEFCNDFFVESDEAIPLEALRAARVQTQDVPPLTSIALGVDIGREQDDYAAVAIGLDESRNAWISEIGSLHRAPFPTQAADLREKVTRLKPQRVVMDRTFNPQSTEDAQREFPYIVEPFVFGAQSKIDLVANASAYFTAGRVRTPPRNWQALDEISNIRKVISDAGNIQYKDKPHGDIGWAALLAFWGLRKTETEFEPIFTTL